MESHKKKKKTSKASLSLLRLEIEKEEQLFFASETTPTPPTKKKKLFRMPSKLTKERSSITIGQHHQENVNKARTRSYSVGSIPNKSVMRKLSLPYRVTVEGEQIDMYKLNREEDDDMVTMVKKELFQLHRDRKKLKEKLGFLTFPQKYWNYTLFDEALKKEMSPDYDTVPVGMMDIEYLHVERTKLLKEILFLTRLSVLTDENECLQNSIASLELTQQTTEEDVQKLTDKFNRLQRLNTSGEQARRRVFSRRKASLTGSTSLNSSSSSPNTSSTSLTTSMSESETQSDIKLSPTKKDRSKNKGSKRYDKVVK